MVKRVHRTKATSTVDGKEVTDEVEEEGFWLESVPSYTAIVGTLVALATAIVGVYTYRHQGQTDIASRTFEATKPFYDKQTAFYVDAMETVATIANSPIPSQGNLSHFWQLYWGPLAAVEDNRVDNAMVIFGKRLSDTPPARRECLMSISLLLAHCVKQSWSDTWHVQLDKPPELPCTDASFAKVSACK